MNRRTFFSNIGVVAVSGVTAPTIIGRVIYRCGPSARWFAIDWEKQSVGDRILSIDWNRGCIERMVIYKVAGPVDLLDKHMPVQIEDVVKVIGG